MGEERKGEGGKGRRREREKEGKGEGEKGRRREREKGERGNERKEKAETEERVYTHCQFQFSLILFRNKVQHRFR